MADGNWEEEEREEDALRSIESLSKVEEKGAGREEGLVNLFDL